MKKILTLCLLSALFVFNLSAQKMDHVPGQIMVQMQPGQSARHLAAKMQTFKGMPTKMAVVKEVSQPMRVWLLSFDDNQINEKDLLAAMKRRPEIILAQFNHILEMRETVPNDPSFNQQWQWVNTGQGGGIPDADVDADQAWDITTGGTTAAGDKIVICILEGTNRNHPDLQGNLWFNENEIPDNGIDDDGNGYLDDYEGWNISNHTDEIPAEGHGTTVAGMIGAKGNNGTLLTGINWDVTIMNVEFNGINEANAVESYTYPWMMRKFYNETNGQKGAFVVATNASWGLDNADPASAPIWCAIYDSLGTVGILSCGATANNNVNIDEVGDLPTACASEFMVSVTATDRNDIRTFSGFGVETIDVAAPGGQIVSINQNGGPTTTSGTSFASPLVAGLIGLLYSVPCSDLSERAFLDPAGTALLVRDAIFQGVDPKPNLFNETKYGGRVNAFNSLNILLQSCGPCPKPFGIALTDLIDTSATVSWNSTDSTLSTTFRWRKLGDPAWTVIEPATSPILLDLEACTEYEFQLQDACVDTLSGFTNSFVFQSDGCCEPPKDLVVDAWGEFSAFVSWNLVLAANSYNLLLIKPSGNQLFQNITDPAFILFDLEPCTEYSVQVQTVCDGNVLTDFGTLISFKTDGCGACKDLLYCVSFADDASEEWIANVTVADLNNSSASNDGYGDFTSLSTDLVTYTQYPISLTPGYAGNDFDEWFKVWIDFNQDGDFNDQGETVFNSDSAMPNTVTGTIAIPGTGLPGSTRMRVSMRFNNQPSSCVAGFDFGEVEDYCVNIVPGTPPNCLIPSMLDTSAIGANEATLHWSAVPSANSYEVQYRLATVTNWTTVPASSNSLALENLVFCSEYEFQVRSNCVGINSEYSPSFFFTTACVSATDERDGLMGLRIQPNPFSASLMIDFQLVKGGEVTTTIYDATGRQVFSSEKTFSAGPQSWLLQTGSAWPQGIYFVKIQSGEGVAVRKVVRGER